MIFLTIAILIISVIIHEVAHGWAANALGDPTAKLQGRLSLNPVRHIDPIGSILIPAVLVITQSSFLFGWAKPVPYNPYNLKNQRWGEAIVGSAGVLTNLLLAVIFAVITRAAAGAGMIEFALLAAIVVSVNLSLGIFNLLPIPPLDGYTVLRGLLPYKMSMAFREFEERILQGGIFSLILILFLFSYFLSAPFGALIRTVFKFLVGA
ncbi:site-2 protease family protein [Patescibacteria group bacterium]|nr:site-2 protease family protein [Patescibacteria group bacterium]MBU1500413.1 site-2 protease family protein [Patescibacteria group bacterium]MBU2080481.1 site-2 protease family protein [Patescibacteria group bacterium]MBU2123714.1 site-2 protease family protein [Patescibacteria group bacterium]MBU2194570.1 site-2 protease family protein [Patescibacteria group bacterium]